MTATGGAPRGQPGQAGVDARLGVRTLADAVVGERVRVERVAGQGAILQRLQEMGLVRGVEVTIVRFAPLGDPVEVRLRGYALSLRKSEARAVEIAPAPALDR